MDDNNKLEAKISEFKKPGMLQSFISRFQKLPPKAKQQMFIRYIFIVLAVAIAGVLIVQNQMNNSRLVAMGEVVDGLSPTQKAQYYSDNGEYKLAQKIWQDELVKAKDTPNKLRIYFMQSSIAVKFENYQDAKKYADKALKLAPKSDLTYVVLAQLAQAQGDKASAKKYWQQAIKFIDPKDPASDLIQDEYQYKLDALK